jgi:hypothetical protein
MKNITDLRFKKKKNQQKLRQAMAKDERAVEKKSLNLKTKAYPIQFLQDIIKMDELLKFKQDLFHNQRRKDI